MCMPALFRRTHFKETGASSYGLQPLLQYDFFTNHNDFIIQNYMNLEI